MVKIGERKLYRRSHFWSVLLWNGIYVFHLYYFYAKTFSLFAIIESDLGSVYWAEVLDKERMSVAIAWI